MNILVVDNSKSTLFLMKNMLAKYGHQCRTAPDGITALEMLKQEKPDAMFIDWVMPTISGDKLCKLVREQPGMDKVYIIIMSAMLQEESLDYKSFGADACLAKGPQQEMEENITMMLAFAGRETDLGLSSKVVGLDRLFPRQATRELLSLKRHMEAILSALTDGVLELNANNQIVYANPAAVKLLQRNEEGLLAADFLQVFPFSVRSTVEGEISKSRRQLSTCQFAEPIPLTNGTDVMLSVVGIEDDGQSWAVIVLRRACPAEQSQPPLKPS